MNTMSVAECCSIYSVSCDNFILVGPMGAGKSTVGRRLAARLGLEFIDSDAEIERRCGVDIPLIFELEGEAGFRAREKAMIGELATRDGIVLATGGGAVLDSDNRRALAAGGTVIYLYTPVAEQLRRVGGDRHRPLLATADPEARLTELLHQRDPLYREIADRVIDTGGCQARDVVETILCGDEPG